MPPYINFEEINIEHYQRYILSLHTKTDAATDTDFRIFSEFEENKEIIKIHTYNN